jgi:hypothetical protein
MFTQALVTTLRILVFRAGPEDFPYDASHRLSLACLGFALVATTLFFSMQAAPAVAIVGALLNIGMLALTLRTTLAARKLLNRFQQAFNALLTTTSLLTVTMLPFFVQVLPAYQALADKLTKHPELAQQPDQLAPIISSAAGSFLAMMALGLWQLLVVGYVFYKTAGSVALFVLLGLLALSVLLLPMAGGGGAVG